MVNLFLLSRASSDAYEPYMFLKEHSEESLTPGVPSGNSKVSTRFTVAVSVSASVSEQIPDTPELRTGLSY